MTRSFLIILAKRFVMGLALMVCVCGEAYAGEVVFPITIDYATLKSLIVQKIYKSDTKPVRVYYGNNGCTVVSISDPDTGSRDSTVRIETKVKIFAGLPVGGACIAPVEWEGYFEIFQTPYFAKDSFTLRFKVVNSKIYDSSHRPVKLTELLYPLIKKYVQTYLSAYTLDLESPVSDLKKIIITYFPKGARENGQRLLDSLRPGKIYVSEKTIQIDIAATAPVVMVEKPSAPTPMTKEQREQLVDTWETWDAFLVRLITSLPTSALSESERQALLDILLETRHAFIEGIDENSANRDFVRDQFIQVWRKLSPVMRNHLDRRDPDSALRFIALFTASDALSTLDKLGPALGIEISREGLLEMSRMIDPSDIAPLFYSNKVDRELRESLGLGSAPVENDISINNSDANPVMNKTPEPESFNLWPLFYKYAWAKGKKKSIDIHTIKKWIVTKRNFDDYFHRVRSTLDTARETTVKKTGLDKKYQPLFKVLIPSIAWQESCFRQFKVRRGKITYLRSYNRTSVGLMQINERVWRGIYDRYHLRWDIGYNATAGTQIAEMYLSKYILRKIKPGALLSEATIARLVYAMYNGGPGQYKKFLKRQAKRKYYDSDKLFWQKFVYVKDGDWDNLQSCLF